jgi:ElaB/YqjD/DUF883 family membrane-anchored ribosome-binding protein
MESEEMIRRKVEEKRAALTDKIETLEEEVVDTVKGATEAVNDTVEAVKDSVAAVTDSVKDTVGTVKDTVAEGVETVKDWFDMKAHVQNQPWLMLGGAAGLGFLLGRMLPAATVEKAPPEATKAVHTGNGHHREKRHASAHGTGGKKGPDFGPELGKLKALALGALIGTARDMILPEVPAALRDPLREILDGFTQKLGGELIGSEQTESQQDPPRSEEKRASQPFHPRFAQS